PACARAARIRCSTATSRPRPPSSTIPTGPCPGSNLQADLAKAPACARAARIRCSTATSRPRPPSSTIPTGPCPG
ncbi:hypothetical protein CKW47_21305, partial [Bordetella pertussis]